VRNGHPRPSRRIANCLIRKGRSRSHALRGTLVSPSVPGQKPVTDAQDHQPGGGLAEAGESPVFDQARDADRAGQIVIVVICQVRIGQERDRAGGVADAAHDQIDLGPEQNRRVLDCSRGLPVVDQHDPRRGGPSCRHTFVTSTSASMSPLVSSAASTRSVSSTSARWNRVRPTKRNELFGVIGVDGALLGERV